MYNTDFYKNRHKRTVDSAEQILGLVENIIPPIHSVVDVGCGVGTWLSVLQRKGVERIQGIDGSWVDKTYLQIPRESFLEHDLTQKIKLGEKFDLAISLEVAEHLPESNAEDFIDSLTKLSDFVLFSAAIPSQGGVGHINEQWPIYWINLYETKGYQAFDLIRRRIWMKQDIPFWYRQNTLLFVRKSRVSELKIDAKVEDFIPIEIYNEYVYDTLLNPGLKKSFQMLVKALKKSILKS